MTAPADNRGDGGGRVEEHSDGIRIARSAGTKPSPLPPYARGLPILDAAGLEVLKAWRYFSTVPGDQPAIVAALLVVAWAMLRGRT